MDFLQKSSSFYLEKIVYRFAKKINLFDLTNPVNKLATKKQIYFTRTYR